MPKLRIDQREIEVLPGTTVLEAARQAGIEIPTMCHFDGYQPSTSCLVCMVKIRGGGKLVPSCGTAVVDGMEIESETEEVHNVRRSALELLLSDHLGDCLAPCQFGCPARMNIPQMLRQIAAGDMREAIAVVKADIALPAVLGRICPAPCEKVCRRDAVDGAVSICLLKRLAADVDLASGDPYMPSCLPASGKRLAIVGAGASGLSAAYYLAQQGHACVLFDENPKPGGRLRLEGSLESAGANWPSGVLDAEIATITRLAVEVRASTHVGSDLPINKLRNKFDAVLLACGATAKDQADRWGIRTSARGIQVNPRTYETSAQGIFAAGNAIRAKGIAVRSVADGKEAAAAIGQFLAGSAVTGQAESFSTKIGHMDAEELAPMLHLASPQEREEPKDGLLAGYNQEQGARQAERCLHCDCRKVQACKLRQYSALYGAQPRRYKAQRRTFQQDSQHADVIFEPGKCIDCGLCVQIAAAAGEPLGLTFIGRGFDVRVGAPLNQTLAEALHKVAAECVAACPTAALAWKAEPISRSQDAR
jgi:NADPH-dependent glutamate synthase beta subunit-like oxidoreductase